MSDKKNQKIKRLLLIIAGILVFAGGFVLGQSRASASIWSVYSSSRPQEVDFTPLWKVWHIIDSKYVPTKVASTTQEKALDELDDYQSRVWGMAQGLAASLGDPYTVFLPPQENKLFNEDISGHFEGVGMEIAIRDGVLTVVSPLKGTPAYKAGIKAGDKILEIDDVSTEGINIQDAVQKIRGPKGSKVKFKILREGESDFIEVEVLRDTIKIPTIETSEPEDGVFMIELMSFTEDSPKLFANALAKFVNSKDKKLIIDLRGNPGGYLDAAVEIASWFLPKGSLVVTEDFGKKRPKIEHRSKGYDIFDDIELVVLIDKGSASASEILAGALRAHKKAKLIGVNSFGKGSVQELVPITKDTSLKVTVARFLLPDGEWIMEKGIKPDIEVEFPKKEELMCNPQKRKEFEDKDLILEKALEYLKAKK